MTNQISIETKFKIGDKAYLIESWKGLWRLDPGENPVTTDRITIGIGPLEICIRYGLVDRPWLVEECVLYSTEEQANAVVQRWNSEILRRREYEKA